MEQGMDYANNFDTTAASTFDAMPQNYIAMHIYDGYL